VTWEIRLPYRDPASPVTEIAECARHLPDEAERAVVRQLALDLQLDHGCRSVGDAVSVVESADPAARRVLLDRARQRAGLPTTDEAEAHQRFEAASRAARVSGGASSAWQMCGEPSCNQAPVNHLGAPVPVDVRRWWCEAHRDQAQPGDMQPVGSGIRISESGALVPDDPNSEAREAASAESRRRLHDDRVAARQVEAAEAAESERLRAAAFRRELPPGIPG
jgi:hypothetical protein